LAPRETFDAVSVGNNAWQNPKTLNRWETGKAPIPVDLATDLERLAYTLAPKPVAPD